MPVNCNQSQLIESVAVKDGETEQDGGGVCERSEGRVNQLRRCYNTKAEAKTGSLL